HQLRRWIAVATPPKPPTGKVGIGAPVKSGWLASENQVGKFVITWPSSGLVAASGESVAYCRMPLGPPVTASGTRGSGWFGFQYATTVQVRWPAAHQARTRLAVPRRTACATVAGSPQTRYAQRPGTPAGGGPLTSPAATGPVSRRHPPASE